MMEGHIPLDVPGVTASTYYKVVGKLDTTPLIVIHGGPSGGHEYLLPFAELWERYHIPVIFYDQVGCASSPHLPEKDGDRDFWTMDIFLSELHQLIKHFKLESYDILGQSWGGMIAPMYAGERPKGLRKLIIASGISDIPTIREGSKQLVEALGDEFRVPILKAMETEEFGADFFQAMPGFYKEYLWREGVPPAELGTTVKHVQETTIHRTVFGRSFLTMRDGTLEDYSSLSVLPRITAPTLVYYGQFDSSHALTQKPFVELIPDVREVVIQGGAHMCHMEPEHKDEVLNLVGKFLRE